MNEERLYDGECNIVLTLNVCLELKYPAVSAYTL